MAMTNDARIAELHRNGMSSPEAFALDALMDDLVKVRQWSIAESPQKSAFLEVWSDRVCIGALALGWLANATSTWLKLPVLNWLALALLVVGGLATIGVAAYKSRLLVREWKSMEMELLGDIGRNLSRWYEAIREIRRAYSPQQLRFAKSYFSAVAKDARSRIALFVGALEKVGLIPSAVTLIVTLVKFRSGEPLSIFIWYTGATVAGILYVFTLKFIDVAMTLERFVVILEHASDDREAQQK